MGNPEHGVPRPHEKVGEYPPKATAPPKDSVVKALGKAAIKNTQKGK
jgi:hypothetical protein